MCRIHRSILPCRSTNDRLCSDTRRFTPHFTSHHITDLHHVVLAALPCLALPCRPLCRSRLRPKASPLFAVLSDRHSAAKLVELEPEPVFAAHSTLTSSPPSPSCCPLTLSNGTLFHVHIARSPIGIGISIPSFHTQPNDSLQHKPHSE